MDPTSLQQNREKAEAALDLAISCLKSPEAMQVMIEPLKQITASTLQIINEAEIENDSESVGILLGEYVGIIKAINRILESIGE